ncbi:MAG: tetratricopeptide (TPR) repeat protein [Flavobacteriaceae bacterium]|jgi:tetratricopeptide (TPR) repeat protein
MKIFVLLITLSIVSLVHAQEDNDVKIIIGEAIEKMEEGDIKGSLKLLKKAKKLEPNNITVDYETAFAYGLDKNFKKAIATCEKMTEHPDVFARVYQMLGNNYDYNEEPEKAIEAYERGMNIFPNSGPLYLERGNMELMKDEFNNALTYYITGIEVDPKHSSNYYRAAKLYLASEDTYLGLIYGELFMNLERGSARTSEMSELLYNAYDTGIEYISDTSMSVNFASDKIDLTDGDLENLKLPYGVIVYAPVITISLIGTDEVSLSSLAKIRANFINIYYEQKHNEEYPNVLFEYHKEMIADGHFEAYNHWLMMKGDSDAFDQWLETNQEKWDDFINWYNPNPIEITAQNKFEQPK